MFFETTFDSRTSAPSRQFTIGCSDALFAPDRFFTFVGSSCWRGLRSRVAASVAACGRVVGTKGRAGGLAGIGLDEHSGPLKWRSSPSPRYPQIRLLRPAVRPAFARALGTLGWVFGVPERPPQTGAGIPHSVRYSGRARARAQARARAPERSDFSGNTTD